MACKILNMLWRNEICSVVNIIMASFPTVFGFLWKTFGLVRESLYMYSV